MWKSSFRNNRLNIRYFYRLCAGPSGFGLVELMIALLVGLIVLFAVYGVYTIQNKQFSNQEQIVEMQQNARAAMDVMIRDIRMAGYDPAKTGNFKFQSTASNDRTTDKNNIAFTCDSNADGTLDTNDSEQMGFNLQNGVLQRFSISAGAASWQALAENIDTLEFTYTLKDGTEIAPPSSPTATQVLTIAEVKIKLTAKTAKADSDYTDPTNGDHYRRYTLTSQVTPRNLGL